MTSIRKVKDATQIANRPPTSRARRSPLSPYVEEILACLDLEPPRGILIEVPKDVDPEKFRRNIRNIVTRHVVPHSSYRFHVTIAVDGSILVACRP